MCWSIEDTLSWKNAYSTDVVKHTVTIVDSTCDEGVYQCFCNVSGHRTAYRPQLSQIIEIPASKSPHMCRKLDFTVKNNSKACHFCRHSDVNISDSYCAALNFSQLLPSAKPDELCLISVQFQTV